MTLTSGLPAYSGAKATSPPTVGQPKQLPYQLMPDTTPSTRRRVFESSNSPKLSESRRAMGRAPIEKMSLRILTTPEAARWNGSMNDGGVWLSIFETTAE